MAEFSACFEILIERDFPKRDHNTDILQQAKLFRQIRTAAVELSWSRFIIGRRAPDDGGNIAVLERQAVVLMNRVWLVGKSIPVERFIQPISTAISRKNPSSPISTVRRRRQTDYE